MIRLQFTIDLSYQIAHQPSDFIFNIHAAQTDRQRVVTEHLDITPEAAPLVYADPIYGTRFMQFKSGPGPLNLHYAATVDIDHHSESPACIEETPVSQLPSSVLAYLYPSRYCQSDRLRRFATREFGHLRQGYWRVQAINDWVRLRTQFLTGSSNVSTSAIDTLIDQVGVCREFAHLMIALCRAVNIPARFVTGIDYGAAIELGPTDFHAYVEVYLGTAWYLFDPTGISPTMGLVRIGTGRDAADVSFATMYGSITSRAPAISIVALENSLSGHTLPRHSTEALSSMTTA